MSTGHQIICKTLLKLQGLTLSIFSIFASLCGAVGNLSCVELVFGGGAPFLIYCFFSYLFLMNASMALEQFNYLQKQQQKEKQVQTVTSFKSKYMKSFPMEESNFFKQPRKIEWKSVL